MTTRSQPAAWQVPPIDDKLHARLANGARLRADMQRQIERGQQPGPAFRVEWLRQPAKEIVLVVAKSGEEFNATHPEDGFSLAEALGTPWRQRRRCFSMRENGGA